MKLAIGTAQFGLDYGVSNTVGRTSSEEVSRILNRAKLAGIDTLDTAAVYGDSEQVLGQLGVDNWRIISKVPPLPNTSVNGSEWVLDHVRRSLARLRVNQLDGLLLHRASDILEAQGRSIVAGLRAAKAEGMVSKIGYSIYSPHLLSDLFQRATPDLIQAPFNIFDQRLPESGWLGRMVDAGVEVHLRSIFLQGLLLMQRHTRPAYFNCWNNLWQRWDALVDKYGGVALPVCLGVAKAQLGVSRIVVGVESLAHLEQLIEVWKKAEPIHGKELSCDDPLLIEPNNWVLK